MLPYLVMLHMIVNLTFVRGLSTIANSESTDQDHNPNTVRPGCYFSAEYQGEFIMQINSDNSLATTHNAYDESQPIVQYSTLNISSNEIPIWGYCHKKIGDNYLLRDPRGGYSECIRCFRLIRRSRNIIELHSKDLNRCFTNEISAADSCQNLNDTSILYRIKEVGGGNIRNEYCPISGKYNFKYNAHNDPTFNGDNSATFKYECNKLTSEISNCPDGSLLKLRFKECSFDDHEITLECLGGWPTSHPGLEENSHYVAFIDSRGSDDYTGPMRIKRPRYRCGLYHVNSKKGKTYLTLSSDSHCSPDIANSTSSYEKFVLSKATVQKIMPKDLKNHATSFPRWAQGEWEETMISNRTMTFTDLNTYKSYTFVAMEKYDATGRFIVFSRDQCENDAFICLVIKQRSENVLEFTTGTVSSPVFQSFVCDEPNVLLNRSSAVWWTLARQKRVIESPCPITGQYIGHITDLPGLCAELSSNCTSREVMYYKVTDCKTGELWEERTYLCLGQWEEDGITYSYTMRKDTNTSECFVGSIISDDEIYIKEAGDYCIRKMNPKTLGMRLYKKGQCYVSSILPQSTIQTKLSTDNVSIMKITTSPKPMSSRRTTPTMRSEIKDSVITTSKPFKRSHGNALSGKALVIILVAISIVLAN